MQALVVELFICNFSKETVHLLSSLLPPNQSPLNMTLFCAQWVASWLLWFFFTQQPDENTKKGKCACGATHLMEFDLRLSKPNLSLFCSVGIWGQKSVSASNLWSLTQRLHSTGGILVPSRPLKALGRLQNGKMLEMTSVLPSLEWLSGKLLFYPLFWFILFLPAPFHMQYFS